MNIVFDNIIFSLQKAGGISVVWYELLKRLLNDTEINLKVLDNNADNLYRKLLYIPEDKILNNDLKLPVKIGRYFSPIIGDYKEPGIFHSSYYRISTQKELKNITTVHDFTYEYFRKGLTQINHSYQKRNAVLKSAGVICVSENTKRDLLKFYPKVNEDNVKVVYNGVDKAYTKLSDISSYKKMVPFEERGYLLYVGDRKSSYKNFKQVVFSANNVHMPLVIVGSPLSKNEYNFMNETLGFNQFAVLSQVDIKELNILYNAAFCLLYPSSYEGFGIPILEAQRAECPVICCNTSSIPEVAGDGALLINNPTNQEIETAINSLKNGTQNSSLLVGKGIENAARFSWDTCYQETLNFYQSILSK